jgi:hypothetical protein
MLTGIIGDERQKAVEFTWRWDFSRLPDTVPKILGNTDRPGVAYFALYDDGWRLVRIQ